MSKTIDFGQPLVDFDGKPYPETVMVDGKEAKQINTLRQVVTHYLSQHKAIGEDAVKAWDLLVKIAKSTESLDLSTDEMTLLTKVLKQDGPRFTIPVEGQVWEMLQ